MLVREGLFPGLMQELAIHSLLCVVSGVDKSNYREEFGYLAVLIASIHALQSDSDSARSS